MTLAQECIIYTFNKGYRVTDSGGVLSPKGKKLKPDLDSGGYPRISIRYNNKPHTFRISRLMAYQKFGSKMFEEGMEVRHLNGLRGDTSINNIEIGTHSENMMDIPKDRRVSKAAHASSFIKKFSNKKIEEIRKYHFKVKSYKRTMEEYNISSKGTLLYILNHDYINIT